MNSFALLPASFIIHVAERIHKKNPARAIFILESAEKEHPTDYAIKWKLSTILFLEGEFDKALPILFFLFQQTHSKQALSQLVACCHATSSLALFLDDFQLSTAINYDTLKYLEPLRRPNTTTNIEIAVQARYSTYIAKWVLLCPTASPDPPSVRTFSSHYEYALWKVSHNSWNDGFKILKAIFNKNDEYSLLEELKARQQLLILYALSKHPFFAKYYTETLKSINNNKIKVLSLIIENKIEILEDFINI